MSFAPAPRLRLAAHQVRTQGIGSLSLPIGSACRRRRLDIGARIRIIAHDPETLHRFIRFGEMFLRVGLEAGGRHHPETGLAAHHPIIGAGARSSGIVSIIGLTLVSTLNFSVSSDSIDVPDGQPTTPLRPSGIWSGDIRRIVKMSLC
jgi:hypothetical protein